ncbi:tandem-95 repeat protein, partial [uncultured Polaribacter sp.]|uniref:tandem-95 repeat protein n=1 Tax=uncultured Polaribacter sp. TaxID=174711 RepID=UPI002612E2A2
GTTTATSTLNIEVGAVNDAPVADDEIVSTNEDTPITVDVLDGDTDTENDTLTITEINGTPITDGGAAIDITNLAGTVIGTVALVNGELVVTPSNNSEEDITFNYRVSDGDKSDTGMVTVDVVPVNDIPVNTVPSTLDVAEDNVLTITGISATDVDGDLSSSAISVTNGILNVTASGSAVVSENGTGTVTITGTEADINATLASIKYTPAENYNGSETLTILSTDSNGETDSDDVAITVTAVNDNPVAVTDTYTTQEDTSTVLTPLTGDSDLDGDTIRVLAINGTTIVANTAQSISVSNGTVTTDTAGVITFTPSENYVGTTSFQYTITDDNGGLSTANQEITVSSVNDFPVAVDDTYTTPEDEAIVLTPLTTGTADSDVDSGDVLSISKINGTDITPGIAQTILVDNGVVTTDIAGVITFTPTENYNGSSTFTYTISDGNGGTSTANQTITVNAVNDRPVAVADSATTPEDTLLTKNVIADGILGNDSDVDTGDTLTVTALSVGAVGVDITLTEGVLNVSADGTYTFDPADNYVGNVPTITYTVSDGTLSTTSTIDIEVTAVNDAPTPEPDTKSTPEDTTLNVATTDGLLKNDTDADGDSLTVTEYTVNGITATAGGSPITITEGILAINPDGSYIFVPALNYNGNVPTITYTVSDGTTTATSTLNIEVGAVNDAPVLVADTNTTTEDTPITIAAAAGVLSNDSDIESEVLTVTQFTINGTNYPAGTEADLANKGKLTINSDGGYVFTPASDYSGTFDVVTYTVSDGSGTATETSTSTLTLTVSPVNDVPVAVADTNSTLEDTPLTVVAGVGTGLLQNDTDVEGSSLVVTTFTVDGVTYNAGQTASVTEGTIQINIDGGYTFTPASNYSGSFPVVNYAISDGVNTATSTLTLTVGPVNDLPVAVDDTNTIQEDTSLVVNAASGVLNNDSDEDSTIKVTGFQVDGQSYIAGETATITEGSIVINADGSYTLTPASDYNGNFPTVTYTISDDIETVTADLDIEVTAINDSPTVVADTNTVLEDTTLTVPVGSGILSNDSDVDTGDTLSVTQFVVDGVTVNVNSSTPGTTTINNVGSITINSDGSYEFIPVQDFNGTVPTITYTAFDGVNSTNSTLDISVTAVNDDPVAMDDTSTTDPGNLVNIPVLTNDSDVDTADSLTVTITVPPTKGTATVLANGTVDYTPEAGFNNGTDTFTYEISDGNGGTDTAVVTITVPQSAFPPVANADTNQIDEEVTLVVAVGDAKNLLNNDTDGNLDPLAVVSFTIDGDTTVYNAGDTATTTDGSITINADGSYTFIPVQDYSGDFPTITYTIEDDQGSTPASSTLDITVNNINDAPVVVSETETTLEDTTRNINTANGLLNNDTDVDGDALSISTFTIDGDTTIYNAGQTANITDKGSILINSDGSYTFIPASDFNGDFPQITYSVFDGTVNVPATLDIEVTPVNDAPVAVNDTANSTLEDTPITIDTVGLNDTDDGTIEPNSVVLIDPSDPGNTSGTSGELTIVGKGVYVVNTDGDVTFTPEDDFNGTADVNYTIEDNDGAVSNVGTINIEVESVNDAPVLVSETNSTLEDTTLTITAANGLLINDSDVDGDPLSITTFNVNGADYNITETATILGQGSISITSDGAYTFIPAEDFYGNYPVITYSVSDGTTIETATLEIEVIAVNDAPVAVNDDSNIVDEDSPITINTVGLNDTDDGTINPASITLIDPNDPLNTGNSTTPLVISGVGTYTVNSTGDVTFTPEDNFSGTADVNYTIEDNDGVTSSNQGVISIEVTPVNDAPVAQPDTVVTPEDTAISVTTANGLLNNDTDVENNSLSVTEFTVGGTTYPVGTTVTLTEGVLTIQSDGSYTFTPATDFNGSVPEIVYTVSDGTNTSNSTLNIAVTSVNDAPVAVDDSGNTTPEETSITINTIGTNDTDDDGVDATTITLIDPNNALNTGNSTTPLEIPGVGIYTVNSLGDVTFTPEDDFTGTADVNYTIEDNDGVTSLNEGVISIEVTPVNDAPVANPDTDITVEDTELVKDAANGLIKNDTDVDSNSLSVTEFTVAGSTDVYPVGSPVMLTEGVLTIQSDGSYTFTPATDFNGSVPTVTYTVSDLTNTANSTLDITVTSVNDAPVAVNDSGNTLNEDDDITIATVGLNDTDDDTIDITTVTLIDPSDPSNTGNTTTPLVISGIGTYSVDSNGNVTFVPEENYNGTADVNYTINDNDGVTSNVATIEITVTPVNDAPVSMPDEYTINEGDPLVVDAANGLLSNDVDSDGDTLTITEFTVGGATYPVGTTVTTPEGDITIYADGSLMFIPSPDFNGTLPAIYTAVDGGDIANSTLTIIVEPVNDAPVAQDDTAATDPGVSVIINVLANDSDIDGDQITVSTTLISSPSNGTVVINTDGTITYNPAAGFSDGTDVFEYQICDAQGLCDSASVTVTLTDDLLSPIANPDTNSVIEDTTLVVGITNGLINNNDIDPNVGDILSVVGFEVDGQSYVPGETAVLTEGTITIGSGGDYTFVPSPNYNGTVPVINYTISDGTGTTNSTSTLTLSVLSVNDIPVANPDTNTTNEDVSLLVSKEDGLVLLNDTDEDGTALPLISFEVEGQTYTAGQTAVLTNSGEITINGDGSYVFNPADNYAGNVPTITYTISDGIVEVSSTLNIEVIAVNDAPIIVAESATTSEETAVVIPTITSNDTDESLIDPTTIILIDPSDPSNTGDSTTPLEIDGVGTYEVDNLGNVTFTPETNYTGSADVNYTVSDGALTSNPGTIEITVTPVNDAPIVVADVNTTPEDVTLTVDASNGLLDNDSDIEGTQLTVTQFEVNGQIYLSGQTANLIEGSLTINSDGSYTFTPTPNYQGVVPTVTYTVSDGEETATTTLDITVSQVNDLPVVVDDENTTTPEDMAVVIPTITSNDTDDIAIDPRTIILIDPNNPLNTGDSSTPLVISGVGTYEVDDLGNVTFTPEPNYTGPADINYTVSDGILTSNPGTIEITVTPVNDAPILIVDTNTTLEDTILNVDAANGVLANDSDIEGTPLTVLEFTINNVDYTAGDTANLTEGSITINSDGSYTFTPATDYTGTVPTITYSATDGEDDLTSTLDITVSGVNDTANTVDDSTTGVQNTPIVVSDITGNDTDTDGTIDPSTVTLIDPNDPTNTGDSTTPLVIPGVGTYEVDDLGNVTFTPEPDFTGDAVVNYTVEDNDGLTSEEAMITVTVQPDNDGDGIPNSSDLDDDNDGIPDSVENGGNDPFTDSDNDGIPNYLDPDNIIADENGDGVDDAFDTDGDGIIDQFDTDADGDGITDIIEAGGTDIDNDGQIDNFTDANNDGLDDATATTPLTSADTDGDGIADYLDIDSDNDGILDIIESQDPTNYISPSGIDSDADGIDDAFDVDCTPCGSITGTPITPLNSDTDALPNYLDIDSDNDGIVDNIEWQTTSGYQLPGPDMDGNGLADNYEVTPGSGIPIYSPTNTDGTNPPDYLNLDSDGDGLSDTIEAYDIDADNIADTVASGNDSDNDGLDDAFDNNPNGISDTTAATNSNQDVTALPNDQNAATAEVDFRDNVVYTTPVDTDGDGINDDVDIDDDNDGIIDSVEALGFVPSDVINDPNCLLPAASFTNPIYVAGSGSGQGTIGAKYRFENVLDVTGYIETGGILDAIVEITATEGGASLISIDNSSTGSVDAWQPEFTVPTPTNNVASMSFKLILLIDDTETQFNINRFGGTIYDIDGANAQESVILERPGLYAVAGNTLLTVDDNAATGLVTFTGPDDTYSGVDLAPRIATYFNYYNTSTLNVTFSAELLSATSNTSLGSMLFDLCSINGLFDGNTTSSVPTDVNGTSQNSGPGVGVVYTVSDAIDSDNDGIADNLDIDSDNDGIPDNVEAQLTDDYIVVTGTDTDGDGLADVYDNATSSGLLPIDTDGDFILDYLDTDSDNDSLTDTEEAGFITSTENSDTDGDGLLDSYDDVDTTGLPFDVNDDQDNGASDLPNSNTSTTEVDYREILDSDGDGITDSVDLDDDNDGILDTVEQDGDPLRDTDGDGTPDHLDLDSDGDGVNDLTESGLGLTDADNDGVIDGSDTGSGANGLFDGVETTPESGTTDDVLDTDGDGIPNFQDVDDDGDGIDTIDENYDAANNDASDQDSDGDSIPDYLDTDDDNDGVLTADEDNDNDGIFLNNDDDDNGDGIPDYLDDLDTDGDGIPDSEDPDDDNDGNPDTTDDNDLVATTAPDELIVVEGVENTVNVLSNDDFIPGSTISITNAGTGTATGIVTFDPLTGEMTYTSAPGEEGTSVTVDYTVCNTDVDPNVCVTETVTITVQKDNDKDGLPDVTDPDDDNDGNPDTTDPNVFTPTTAPDAITIANGSTETLNILDNDDFLPSANTTITNAGTGTGTGTVTFDNLTGEMTYTPAIGEEDIIITIDYTVCNIAESPYVCLTETVTITINNDTDDTDGDGIPDIVDLDDDNDGIPDTVEQNGDPLRDTDGDGIPDHLDLDSDGDGVSDVEESGNGDLDTDGDGVIDAATTGSGANGLFDGIETTPESGTTTNDTIDTDEDGIPNFQDTDDDGDGIETVDEDVDSDGDPTNDDTDGDGIPNYLDTDDDGDGVDTADEDVDQDGDSTNDDTDGDGIPNYLDTDDDGDGVDTADEDVDSDGDSTNDDTDGDGTPNYLDTDDDGDGIDTVDEDNNNNGDLSDDDSDGDGIPDYLDTDDTDGDGIPDSVDLDDDNDGIPDTVEQNGDPLRDTDGDGIPDHLDLDSDGDGVSDVEESGNGDLDTDGDGVIDAATTGSGANGLFDGIETTPESGTTTNDTIDTDGDGIPNFQDTDDDGDGIETVDEDVDSDGDPTNDDTDGDGIPNYLDTDDDGDGVDTADEDVDQDGDPTNDDTDGDGIPNYLDTDDDGDGVDTADEDVDSDGDSTNDDTDGDGIPNYLDTDDDGDGVDTADEDVDSDGDSTNDDTDGDGIPNYLDTDDDGDGVDTEDEDVDSDGDSTNDDTDGDGIPNYLDTDDDGDGVDTADEDVNSDGDSTNDDTDGDGIPNYLDTDDDGDGVDTADEDVENQNGDPTDDDTDNDGIPDYLDPDDDGDGVDTIDEDVDQDGDSTNDDTDGDGIPNYLDTDDDGDGVDTEDEDINSDGDLTNDDTDGDGIPDYLDTDDDGDGVDTADEDVDQDGDPMNDDTDGDGIPDYLDPDDDGDGIDTIDENVDDILVDSDGDGIPDYLDVDSVDSDGDGIPDSIDLDDDNDGIPDLVENDGDFTLDTDGDGIPDHLDLDSDGDGLTDLEESGSNAPDVDNDGVIDGDDSEFGDNGLYDDIETDIDSGDIDYDVLDSDGDGVRDFQDADDDGDGVDTADEDVDQDGDPTNDDTDGDGIPNYLDIDDDGDGVNTVDEFMFDCDTDSIPDHIDITNCELIPNGFSPNGDGVNDTFVIPGLSEYPNFKLEIYNRWGNQVYDYNNNGRTNPIWWGGYSTGRLTIAPSKQLPTGTYYYIIYFNDGTKEPINGWVYLNR